MKYLLALAPLLFVACHPRRNRPGSSTPTSLHPISPPKLESAWNAADGDRYGSVFTDGASFVDIRGDHHRSRTAIGKGHQAIFDGIYRDSTVHFEVTSAEVVGVVVVAHVKIAMEAPRAPLPPNDGSRRASSSSTTTAPGGSPRSTTRCV